MDRLKGNYDYFQEKENLLQDEIGDLKVKNNEDLQKYYIELGKKDLQIEKVYSAYKSYKDFVDFIPKDLLNKLNKAYHEQKRQQELQEQEWQYEMDDDY